MRFGDMTGNDERKISSLRDLPLDIAPARDLWQGIEARLNVPAGRDKETPHAVERGRRLGGAGRMRLFAAAAVIAALAVGIWIGRAVLAVPGGTPAGSAMTGSNGYSDQPAALHAA